MLKALHLRFIFIVLSIGLLGACQLIDTKARAWSMIEIDPVSFAQGKEFTQQILIEEGRQYHHLDLTVLHNNQTEDMSMDLDIHIETIQGKVVYQAEIPVAFANKMGVWLRFGLVTHEVNISVPKNIYIQNPGLYRLRIKAKKGQYIKGISLIGFRLSPQ